MAKELRFPEAGVNRRLSMRAAGERRERYFSPWCVNMRLEDNLDRRLRGGSRPGLTKFVNEVMGSTIADMASLHVSSASGSDEILLVLVDSSIVTVSGGNVVSSQLAYLTNESGEVVTDEDENPITISEGSAPSSGFLVTGQQKVFAVTAAGVTKMDPKTRQVEALQTVAGAIPTNCTFGAVYRNRLCLSGNDNAIYMSRQGVYGDFFFGAHFDDQQRAIAFQLALASDVGAPPTAMIPCMDSYLLCASARSLWVVNGDPASGELRRISETIGIIGPKAWVKTDTSIVFLSQDGLWQVQADGSGLKPLSRDAIPDELRDVDLTGATVSMGYEADRPAFHIYLRTSEGSDTHWVYEVASQAFWPVRLQDGHSPRAVCQHRRELLLAGSDGYVRKVTGDDDDGAAVQSHLIVGPFRLGVPGEFGRMLNLQANIAAGSGRVNWRILTGDTAEEAADNAKAAIEAFQSGGSHSSLVKGSGNWAAGRSIMVYPRVRAIWCCLWLQSTDKWAFESLLWDA